MTPKLTKALCGFYADVSTIHKDSRGNFGKYADLATVLSAVNPALAKNGLAIVQTFDTAESGDHLLCTHLLHDSGESLVSRLPLIVAKGRNPLHDWGGATTYQRRYALLAMLNLAAGIEDDDGESATGNAAPAVKAATPAAKPAAKQAAKPVPKAAPPADVVPKDEVDLCITCMKELSKDQLTGLLDAFRAQFSLPADAKVAGAITTPERVKFITDHIAQLQ